MEYALNHKPVAQLKTDCLILFATPDLANLKNYLPEETLTQLQQHVKAGDFSERRGHTLLVHQPAALQAKRLLLTSLGKDTVQAGHFFKILTGAFAALKNTGSKKVALAIQPLENFDAAWQVRQGIRCAAESTYRYQTYRSKPQPNALQQVTFHTDNSADIKQALKEGSAVALGVVYCRDLANCPPNVCFPAYLSAQAKDLATRYPKLKVSVISEQQAEKLGMGAFCSVARGSENSGQIIVLEYKGAKGAPVGLVGKGITFDTGGISLKPGAGMDEMKYDMGGAASVLGSFVTLCELDLPLNVVGIIAAAENMPDGRASRPGDIVKTLSGQTVEILNTDAEGRLVLCDALTYIQQKFKPHTVIDIATLTGACVVALGSQAQAVYANDHELGKALIEAGDEVYDRAWPMPLWDEYQEQLDSPFADMANIGGPKAGSVTAACFLSRFTKEVKWAHLDIAGTAWNSGPNKGATGRPVTLLTQYLINLAN